MESAMITRPVWALIFSATLFLVVATSIYLRTHPDTLSGLFTREPEPPEYRIGTFYAEGAEGTQQIMAIHDFLRTQDGVLYVRIETGNYFVIKFDRNRFDWKNAWRAIRYNDWAKFSASDFVVSRP
ncbi:hypothetical protein TspCOW1_06070 [Thiohalobacter sp. COW1]|nr:hypothetical protein TspCOW1_06070 [Thiohalobacter sp. COW1]